MEEPGNTLKFGNYEILKREDGSNIELGRGSYGVTYKASHRYLRKVVALKVIHDRHMENAEATQRFLTEAQIVASLDHRNIARVSDFGELDGIFYYAMEFCDGGSLEDLANQQGPLSWPAIIPLARQIAEALECAHSSGMLHRDIKPSNLMLVGDSQGAIVKLIDFGLVKVLESAEKSSTFQMMSRDGGFIGNPMSAAPEQLLEETIDARADLFSLGITLWYLLLAKSPFDGVAPAKLVHERLSDKPYSPGDIPGLDDHGRAILAKLIAKDPDQRFACAGDLIQALDDPYFGRADAGATVAAYEPAPEQTPDVAPAPVEAPGPTAFDGLRIVRRMSSNSQGVVVMVDHPRGGCMIVAHPDVARVADPSAGGQVEWGTYGGEPALLFHGLTSSNWDSMYSLGEEPTKAEFLSWFNQIAHVADLFRNAGFVEFDFRPSNILLLSSPVNGAGGRSQWFAAPRFEDNAGSQDAWNSIGGDSLAPTSLSAFVALIYRSLSGMRLKPAAFIKESAYVKSPNLTEAGNNLIASTLSAPPEEVAQTGYADFVLELARSEQIGLIDLAPPPAGLVTPFSAEAPPPALPPQSQSATPVRATASSTPPPLAPASPPALRPEVAPPSQAASTPPVLPAAAVVPAPAPAPTPAPATFPPPMADAPREESPPSPKPPAANPTGGKRIKIIAAAAAVLLIAGVAAVALILNQNGADPKDVDPVVDNGNGGSATHATNGGQGGETTPVDPPAASYEQINLSQVSWLVPEAEVTLFDRDGVIIVNKTTIAESAARIFNFSRVFTDEQWQRAAPFAMVVRYHAEGVCDMTIRIGSIGAERFSAADDSTTRLALDSEGLTAAIKGWFAPRFVPVIENDASGFNDSAALAFADGDPIKAAIHYPSFSDSKAATSTFANGRFEFEFTGATGPPEWVMSSTLFSKDTTLPLQPPFTAPQIPLGVVEVTADLKQTGILLDGLILKPTSEMESPLWTRIRGFTQVLTAQNPTARIVKAEDYEAIISGGPLDGIAIAKVNASTNTKIELPTFPTGYAFGLNRQTPYEVNDRSDPRDAAYLLTMPKDEPWRAVIICYDKGLNDGQGGFHITENIMRAKTFDPATKRIHFSLDFEGRPFRRVDVNLRKVFQSASLEIPINWNAVGSGFSFPAIATTKGRDQNEYTYQFAETGQFAATKDTKIFITNIENYFIHWIISEAKNDEVELTPDVVREKVKLPDGNDMLGKNAFNTDAFKGQNR